MGVGNYDGSYIHRQRTFTGREPNVSHNSDKQEERKEISEVALASAQIAELVESYRAHEKDTGSPEVQIALLTERIKGLTEHFKTHAKDHHSRRGLITLVSQRRSLLDYLKRKDLERYKTLIQRLEIRR